MLQLLFLLLFFLVGIPDIDDHRKHWLLAGICLHSVVSPVLRKYVGQEVQKQYSAVKASNNIDTQTFPKYLKQFNPTYKSLNYEAINNNNKIPKVNRKPGK